MASDNFEDEDHEEGENGFVEQDDGSGVFATRDEALAKKPRPSQSGGKVELFRVMPFGQQPVYCWAEAETGVFEAVYKVAFKQGRRARGVDEKTGEGA
jgi:hypothetical protein